VNSETVVFKNLTP